MNVLSLIERCVAIEQHGLSEIVGINGNLIKTNIIGVTIIETKMPITGTSALIGIILNPES